MSSSSRLTPDEPFPEDFAALSTREVEILNSKVHRELDFEYKHGGKPTLETRFRLEDLHEELNIRDFVDDTVPESRNHPFRNS